MPIVGGLDIHRKQLTFDYLDTATGEVRRGQIAPAGRAHLRAWLARFAGRDDVAFALEGCTGWRYVAKELAAAGVTAHVAEPAGTAFARGRKRHAKTDKTDSRHLRVLLEQGRLPECWVPPAQILECRALLEAYHDLRREHTAWIERIHAVFFHQGAPRLGEGALRTGHGLAALRQAAAIHLSPAGQLQVATALDMLAAIEARMDTLRQQQRDQHGRETGQLGRADAHIQRQESEHQLLHQLRGWFGQASTTACPRKGQQAENGFSRPLVEWPAAPAGPVEKRSGVEVQGTNAAHPSSVMTVSEISRIEDTPSAPWHAGLTAASSPATGGRRSRCQPVRSSTVDSFSPRR